MGVYVPTAEEEADLRPIFTKFDADGSGAIDTKEIKEMIESLGMSVKNESLEKWIKDADEDSSGEIEFGEFVTIMNKAAGAQESGLSLAAILRRTKNSGARMKWRTDKCGPGVVVSAGKSEADTATRTAKEGWGVQLLDSWLSTGDGNCDLADVLLELEEVDGDCWAGVVGRNFNPSEWNEPFNKTAHAVGWNVTAKGECVVKRSLQSTSILTKVLKGQRIQFNLMQRAQGIQVRVLEPGKKDKDGGFEWSEKATVTLNGGTTPAEVAVAVAFGPATSDAGVKVRVVGSSQEKTQKPGAPEEKPSNEAKRAAEDPEAAVANSLTM